ncbi:MAG TPA: hypothetical protein VF101_15715 [Gaiellaceae bacterium]
MEPPDDLTLILNVLLEVRANVRAIRKLLEEDDNDEEGDEEEGR